MFKLLTKGLSIEDHETYRVFLDEDHCGYCFACDSQGRVMTDSEYRIAEFLYCTNHPENFPIRKTINNSCTRTVVYAKALCECGNVFHLVPTNFGLYHCHKCGRWYDEAGNEVDSPSDEPVTLEMQEEEPPEPYIDE